MNQDAALGLANCTFLLQLSHPCRQGVGLWERAGGVTPRLMQVTQQLLRPQAIQTHFRILPSMLHLTGILTLLNRISHQDFTDDFRHRLRSAWRAVEGVDLEQQTTSWTLHTTYQASSEDAPRINKGKEDTQGRGTVYALHLEKQERSQWGSGGLLAVARA
eukprot:1159729-Pelagomonas_calceolata.AAC.5